jgi:hypothetical protein
MGAKMISFTLDACSKVELKSFFNEKSRSNFESEDEDNFNGVGRLTISDRVFKSNETTLADDYLMENTFKYGPALAVQIGDFSKAFPATLAQKKAVEKEQELKNLLDGWDASLIQRTKQSKSEFRGCKKCGSKIAVKYVKDTVCPVCTDLHFISTETDLKRLKKIQQDRAKQYEIVRVLRMEHNKNINEKPHWLVMACVDD